MTPLEGMLMSTVMTAASAYALDRRHVGFLLTADPMGLFAVATDAAQYREVLDSLGVQSAITSCQVSYVRNRYWSDYPEEHEDWNDQWYAMGNVVLGVAGEIPVDLGVLGPDAGISDLGENPLPYPEKDEPLEWAVLAHFPDQESLARAEEAIGASQTLARAGVRAPHRSGAWTISGALRPQLICFLGRHGPEFYESGSSIRGELHEYVEANGGAVHHSDLHC